MYCMFYSGQFGNMLDGKSTTNMMTSMVDVGLDGDEEEDDDEESKLLQKKKKEEENLPVHSTTDPQVSV